jgi:hypothetical protein
MHWEKMDSIVGLQTALTQQSDNRVTRSIKFTMKVVEKWPLDAGPERLANVILPLVAILNG